MPLDGHAFLVNQGWSGAGTGLRNGSISRPISIPQKRNLAGIGKDRDEAFPFWDHLFTVAASAIQIECFSSDDEDGDASTTNARSSTLDLRQTSTGILSNRPPAIGTPISSGDTTPTPCPDAASGSAIPRLSLVALAKREAARRGLYSRFFRGPILGPDIVQSETVETEATDVSQALGDDARAGTEKRLKRKSKIVPLGENVSTEDPNEEAKRQKKLRKKAERAAKKLHRSKGKERGEDEQDAHETTALSVLQDQASELLALETPHGTPHTKKKKNKRRKVSSSGVLDIPPLERTLVEDSSKASRKKRRRNETL